MGRASQRKTQRRAAAADAPEEDGPNRLVRYGYYFVAFIDLLGQRNRLRRVADLQWDQASLAQAQDLLRQAAGPVRRVRRAFENFFTSAAQNRQQSVQLTPDQLREYNRMRSLAFKQAVSLMHL